MGVVGRGGALDMGSSPLETSSGSAPAPSRTLARSPNLSPALLRQFRNQSLK